MIQDTWLRLRSGSRGLRTVLPSRFTLSSLAWLIASNLLKLVLGIAASAIVFRTLQPVGASQVALTLSITGLLSLIGEFGLRDAAVTFIGRALPANPERAQSVARTFFLAKLALSLLAGTLAYFAAGWITAAFYPGAGVANLIQLGAFSLLTGSLLGFSLAVLEAQRSFRILGVLGIVQAVIRTFLILVLFTTNNINPVTLILLEALVPLLVFFYSLRFIPSAFYRLRAPFLEHLPAMFHFAKWIAVAAVASTIFLRLDVLMLSYFRPPAQVGLYAVALALAGRLDIVKSAILTTSFPEATRRTSTADLRHFVRQSWHLTGLASLFILPLLVMGNTLIVWLYGSAYADAVAAFIPLLLAFLCGLNAEPISYVLYALNKPQWIARMDLGLLLLNFSLNMALIPAAGIAGAAYGLLVTRIAGALVTVWMVRRALAQMA